MGDCLTTMEALLKAMLTSGIGASQNDTSDSVINTLYVRQVKIADVEGNLRRVYPAKADLIFEDIDRIAVERE